LKDDGELCDGMVLAIEPVIKLGKQNVLPR
jgi:hypothetical protein